MKLSLREKWMAALLPAIVTGLIYQFGWMRTAKTDADGLRKQIQTQGPLAARTAALQHENSEHGRLERLLATRRQPPTGPGQLPDFNRTAALQQISKLCEAGGLTLLASSPDNGGKLPPSVEQVAKFLVRPGDPAAPQVWRLDLQSSYAGMVELLDGLSEAPQLIVPLGVTMQPNADETQPLIWSLTVWM